jgi:hypothetical protein
MSQTYRKNKNSNDTTLAKVITSPDGTEIQITAGRKLQRIRSLASDPEITDAQFRALVCIIDRLNEGREGTDESRWGSAYPNFETLAKDIAKDERAAKRIIKELESGQRQTRSGGVTTLVPCKSVLTVQRSKDEDEKDNVNLYRLKEWGAFAIAPSGEGAVTCNAEGAVTCKGADTCKEGCGHLQGGVRSPVREGAVTAPDSTYLLTSETHLTDSPQLAPASGEREPADLDEIRLPENHHSMSTRDMFDFLKAAYGNSQPEDADEEWSLFQGGTKARCATAESLVEGINMDRGIYDLDPVDLTKHRSRTFRWFLNSFLDVHEAESSYHAERCDMAAAF